MQARPILAVAALVATGAAAWSSDLVSRAEQPRREARPVSANPSPDRIVVSAPQLSDAYANGLLSREVKSVLKVDRKLHYGDFVWNEAGVKPGPTWIRVDLKSQLISIFRSGEEIGTAVILYGVDDKETPSGEFPILAKMRDHSSSLYDAKMPYTLRLTGDGIAIHGSDVRWGAATHGCVGVPVEFAKKLFDAASVGDPVLIVS